MNRKAQIQSWLTLAAVLALPLLYFGGIGHVLAMSIAGLVVFAGSLLVCPALQFTGLGRRATATAQRHGTAQQHGDSAATGNAPAAR